MLDTGPDFPFKRCHKHGLNCKCKSDHCLSPLAHRLSTPCDVLCTEEVPVPLPLPAPAQCLLMHPMCHVLTAPLSMLLLGPP